MGWTRERCVELSRDNLIKFSMWVIHFRNFEFAGQNQKTAPVF
jgi:hypothetical protein